MSSGFRIGRVKLTTTMMIWLVLAITSVGALSVSLFYVPSFIYYLADALNIALAFSSIRKVMICRKTKEAGFLALLLFLFTLNCIIGVVGNSVPIKLALWGSRNVYRFILFFMSCSILLKKNDVMTFIDTLPTIYVINAFMAIFQFATAGNKGQFRGDYIGGIFGTTIGCNGALIIFLNISISLFIAQYMAGKLNLRKLVLYSGLYFLVAAMSETKGNYVFFLILIATALLVAKKNFKTLGIVLATAIALSVGGYFLNMYFPGSLDFLVDIKSANAYMNASYFGTTTFTRNAALSVANKVFFKNDKWLYLFGYGIGACDTSSFFSSPFYEKFGYMNYRQLSSSMTVLQNGYSGLVIYFGFFIYLFIVGFLRHGKETDEAKRTVMMAVCLFSVFAIVDSFYATIYIDAAYWLFFGLAMPLVLLKDEN